MFSFISVQKQNSPMISVLFPGTCVASHKRGSKTSHLTRFTSAKGSFLAYRWLPLLHEQFFARQPVCILPPVLFDVSGAREWNAFAARCNDALF